MRKRTTVAAAILLASLSGANAAAQALSQAQIDGLTRAASARLAFASKLQGRWTCGGTAHDGHALKATMLLFTVKPTVYEFELTPTPASPKWNNIVETWQWVWSFGTQGRWFSSPDARTNGAGTRYASDGWSGSRLVWKEYVSPSTTTRTFELLADGALTFGVEHRADSAPASDTYRLTCRKSPAR